jgi:hypothetical protein
MEFATLIRNKNAQAAAIGVASFAGGAVAGYFLGKRKATETIFYQRLDEVDVAYPEERVIVIRDEADEPSDEEVRADVERVIAAHLAEDDFDVDAAQREKDRIEALTFKLEAKRAREAAEEDRPVVHNNVFAQSDDEWDYEAELSTRRPPTPYIIHADEFIGDEMGYHQTTLTYYVGDDIMTDTDDTPIYGYLQMMGDLKFGHGSKDPTVVYIRNEGLRSEWEILRHAGKYEQEVLGIGSEPDEKHLRHSHGVPKFRRE